MEYFQQHSPVFQPVSPLQPWFWTHSAHTSHCICHDGTKHQRILSATTQFISEPIVCYEPRYFSYASSYGSMRLNYKKIKTLNIPCCHSSECKYLISISLGFTVWEHLILKNCCLSYQLEFQKNTVSNKFWHRIRTEFPTVSQMTVNVLPPFSATYVCEVVFLALRVLKPKCQSTLKNHQKHSASCSVKYWSKIQLFMWQ